HPGPRLEGTVIADGDGTKDDLLVLVSDHPQHDVARQGDIIADLQEIVATTRELDTLVDVDVLANLRTELAQEPVIKARPFDQTPGDSFDAPLHQPVPEEEPAPGGMASRLVGANEQLLPEEGDAETDRDVQAHSREGDDWEQQRRGDQIEQVQEG